MKNLSSERSNKDEYNEMSVATDKNQRCQPNGTVHTENLYVHVNRINCIRKTATKQKSKA